MRFVVCCGATITALALICTATAASQRDWNDCKASDSDHSIAGCTRILQREDESTNERFAAYVNRGNARFAKGDLDRAIADYNEAIWLNPLDFVVYRQLGAARFGKGDLDRAIADLNEAIRLNPKYPDSGQLPAIASTYMERGLVNFYKDQLPKALADLNQVSELNPKYLYGALWLDIVEKRSNLASRLPETIAQLDMTKWPAPVIRLFLGQTTPESVLTAADDPDVNTKEGQVCEANFYSGELALQKGAKDDAISLFQLAVENCPKNYFEFSAASAELKAVGSVQ